MREKVLLSGEPNTSKTHSIVSLAKLNPDRRVVVFDPDDGTRKTAAQIGGDELSNLIIIPVRTDWEALLDSYKSVKESVCKDDWVCFDMLGRFWELAQQYYSWFVFGKSPIEHLLALRKQGQQTSFGGFEGLTDWTLIKRIHNELLIDDAVTYSDFNVMATTGVNTYLPVEKVPKTGTQGIYASEFGIKVEGEKHNIYRFDTQAVLYRKKDGGYFYRLVRDRGRDINVAEEFDITGKSFWEVYATHRGLI